MSLPFLPCTKPSILEEDRQAVAGALDAGHLTDGSLVETFESTVAAYCAVPYAVAFNSGTAAMAAAYFAARLSASDRVITSPNAFIASIGPALQTGSRICFADIDRATGNIDLSKLAPLLHAPTSRGRTFVVPNHFVGNAVDMAQLDRTIYDPDTIVIEDARHALGSAYPSGEKVGSCAYSQMTAFNFHTGSILTTGEGGLVTTRDPNLFHRLQLFRDNGIEWNAPYLQRAPALGYYEVHAITGNFCMTSLQAALGLSQFRRLAIFADNRMKVAQRYRKHLQNISHIALFTDGQPEKDVDAHFVVQIDYDARQTNREKVMKQLEEKGIETQIHYIPLYYHPVFKGKESLEQPRCPETESYYRRTLSLPLYSDLREEDVDRVCEELSVML